MTATALERLREMDGEIASSFKALEPFESITNRDGWAGLEVRQMLFNLGYEVKDVYESGNPDEETVDNLEVRVSEALAIAYAFTDFGSPLAKSRRGSAEATPPPAPQPEPGPTTLPPPKQRRQPEPAPEPAPAPQPEPGTVTNERLLTELREEIRRSSLPQAHRQVLEGLTAVELNAALRAALALANNDEPTTSWSLSSWLRKWYADRSVPRPSERSNPSTPNQ